MPADTDAARLQVVLRATDPQQASTQTSFSLIVSPVFEVPEEFVTLDESLWQPPAVQSPQTTQDSQWNALLPMEVLFPTNTAAETSGSDLLSASSWPQNVSDPASTFIPEVGSLSDATLDQPASSLDSAAAAAVAAITTAGQTIAELYQDFIREDFIRGTSGDDRYEVSPGAGWQTLLDPDGNDLLRIALSDPEADLRFERQDNDLHMSFTGTNDGLRIAGWYERNEAGAATHQIERFQLTDGRTLLGAEVDRLIAAQSMTGTAAVGQFWR